MGARGSTEPMDRWDQKTIPFDFHKHFNFNIEHRVQFRKFLDEK